MSNDQIHVCPTCDAATLRRRKPNAPNSTASGQWYCNNCLSWTDDPAVRERRGDAGPNGLAKRLLEADPEEVSR